MIASRGDDRRDAVHVARDDMAAEFVADLERALEIDPRPDLPVANRRAVEGFGRRIDLEPAAVAARLDGDHRQAGSAAGDRGAERDRRRVVDGFNPQPAKLLSLRHGSRRGRDR